LNYLNTHENQINLDEIMQLPHYYLAQQPTYGQEIPSSLLLVTGTSLCFCVVFMYFMKMRYSLPISPIIFCTLV